MPKQKTHKGLKKRVKITAKGKIKNHRAGSGHLLSSKNAKRKKRLATATLMHSSTVRKVMVKLGLA